jgi:hypothetical protein
MPLALSGYPHASQVQSQSLHPHACEAMPKQCLSAFIQNRAAAALQFVE